MGYKCKVNGERRSSGVDSRMAYFCLVLLGASGKSCFWPPIPFRSLFDDTVLVPMAVNAPVTVGLGLLPSRSLEL